MREWRSKSRDDLHEVCVDHGFVRIIRSRGLTRGISRIGLGSRQADRRWRLPAAYPQGPFSSLVCHQLVCLAFILLSNQRIVTIATPSSQPDCQHYPKQRAPIHVQDENRFVPPFGKSRTCRILVGGVSYSTRLDVR